MSDMSQELDALLAGGHNAGLAAERLLDVVNFVTPTEPRRPKRRFRDFSGIPERRAVRRAVNFVFDVREAWIIEVASQAPLQLALRPTSKLQAYLDGRHGPDEQELLRAWTAHGLRYLVEGFDAEAISAILVPFSMDQLDGGAEEARTLRMLREELKPKALHAATQGQAPALAEFFRGDVFAARQPTARPQRALPRGRRAFH